MSFRLCVSCNYCCGKRSNPQRRCRAGSVDSTKIPYCPSSEKNESPESGRFHVPSADESTITQHHPKPGSSSKSFLSPSTVPYFKMETTSNSSRETLLQDPHSDYYYNGEFQCRLPTSRSLSSISLTNSRCETGNDPESRQPLLSAQQSGECLERFGLIGPDGLLSPEELDPEHCTCHDFPKIDQHPPALSFRDLNLRHIDSDSCASSITSISIISRKKKTSTNLPNGNADWRQRRRSFPNHGNGSFSSSSGSGNGSATDWSDLNGPNKAYSQNDTQPPTRLKKTQRYTAQLNIVLQDSPQMEPTFENSPIPISQCAPFTSLSNEKPVMKQKSSNEALDLASQSNVQDAFVIAVEQQARERLEKLSALKRIKPVDMTKLSQQLSEVTPGSGETSELNGLIEAATGSPIYVTSVPELSSSQAALYPTTTKSEEQDPPLSTTTLQPSLSPSKRRESDTSSPTVPHTGKQVQPSTRRLSVDELNTTSRVPQSLVNGLKEQVKGTPGPSTTTTANITTPPIGTHIRKSDTAQGNEKVPNGQYQTRTNSIGSSSEKLTTSPKLHAQEDFICPKFKEGITGSRESIVIEGQDFVSPSTGGGFPGSTESSRESIPESTQYANMMNMVEWDNGPHREMAVDVPDSFIPRNKTPPRYPPASGKPIPPSTTSISSNNNKVGPSSGRVMTAPRPTGNGSTGGHHPVIMATTPNGAKPIPPIRIPEKDGWGLNNNNTQVPQVTPRTLVSPNKSAEVSPSSEQADRIKKYQEDLRKRREEEDRLAQEAEFLRTSLRGSKKLQALESVRQSSETGPVLTGIVNDAYETISDDYIPYISHQDALLKKPVGISELVASLQRVQEALKKNGMQLEDTVSAVASLMKKPEFHQVLALHNKVQEVWCFNSPPTPISAHAHQIVQECLGSLYNSSVPESAELLDLLTRVDLDGVLYAHDKIAERERLLLASSESPLNLGESVDEMILPKSPRPMPSYLPAEVPPDDHIRVVRLDKTQDPLGATVRNEGDAVIIGRIVKGGAAEKSGLLHEGDEVLEVNGIEMRGKSVNEVCDILSRMTGTLTFLIIPDQSSAPQPPISQRREILVHVRAHFDYDPEDDIYIPCRELGIAFSKGDVLHVISQDDPNWWQAHREGEEDQALAGLIPSKSFQEQREAVKQTLLGETETREKSKRGTLLLCAKTHKRKKKKIPYSTAFNDDFDADEIPTYEEVALYYPRASFKRPVVLIGPPNIGRHELRQRLMQELDRFAAAVPHTSRSRKEGEVDGQDYHFITRAQFESDILGRKFVEHGEFEKAYYGTSLDAVRSVVNIGRICVLNLHPQSLKILRNSDLKPYIVFVAPPPLERLKQLRISRGEAYKEDELIDIIEKAREMEEKYGHYFDLVIINNDIERTFHELVQRINYIEREPQWVPGFWLKQ